MKPRVSSQQGQALILSILALLVLTLLGLTLTGMGMLSMSASTNEREASEALYIADSGVAHAAGVLALQPGPDFDSVLQSGDGRGCTGDELAEPPQPPAVLPVAEMIPAAGRAFATGRYAVNVCDDDWLERTSNRPPLLPDQDPEHDANGSVLVRSTGLGRNGASATVEATLARVELPGLVVDGPLRIVGGLALMGNAGALHANGAVELQGTPCAERSWSATGSISGAGSALGGAVCTQADVDARPLQARLPVPAVEIAGMRRHAEYVLGADGSIRKAGQVVALQGWSWDGSRWAGDTTVPGGTYYAEGNVELTGNPGPSATRTPLSLSLIAEGWIDVKHVPLAPAQNGIPAYTLVAGTDLRIAGDPDTTYLGLLYAGDQIAFEGSPTVVGQLIAKNAGDRGHPDNPANAGTNNLVRLEDGVMVLRGDARITCPGGGLGSVLLTGWRECRGDNPDNPCGVP